MSSVIPVINDNVVNINASTFPKFRNIGATGPTGPTGPALVVGNVSTNISSYDKNIYNLEGNNLIIDNVLNYKQCVINNFKIKIFPKQDFHGYEYPWNDGEGKNLYNKDEYPFTLNQYINRIDGTVGYNSNFAATDFIPLHEKLQIGDYITISPLPSDQLPGLAFYNNNYGFISGSKGQGAKIPVDTAYIRFTINNEYASGDLVQLEKGTEPTEYTPYANICPFGLVETVKITHEINEEETNITYNFYNYGGYINDTEGKTQFVVYYYHYNGEELLGEWISSHDKYSSDTTPTIGAEVLDYGIIASSIEIPRLDLNLPHAINKFSTSSGIIKLQYEEYSEPSGIVSITTNEQGEADFDFNFSIPVLLGATGPQGIQGATGPTGKGFAIERTYSTVADMYADAANVPVGTFVMIASNTQDEDDAKLYVKNEAGGFTFLTDLSGSQGIQGPTGPTGAAAGFNTINATITKLSPDEEPIVSVSTSGDNTGKNIKFNFAVPQGITGPTGATGPTGNFTYATFDVDLSTGHLIMHSLDYYEGPNFTLTNDGRLEVII